MKFHSRSLGACLTEYIHPHYEVLVNQFEKFYVISQFDDKPNLELPLDKFSWIPAIKTEPICGYGEVLYGMEDNGRLTKLKAIIDASD